MDSNPEPAPTSPGDEGFTSLPGHPRVAKSDDRICALGALDELNAALGLLRAVFDDDPEAAGIESIQRDLLAIGGAVAAGRGSLDPGLLTRLDSARRHLDAALPPARGFVLPGHSETSARAHWARAVCRRAEREFVRARETHPGAVPAAAPAFLNRLSGLLFSLARSLDARG